jgi:hypothetical protein
MDIEAIVGRFVEQGHDEADTRRSIDEYMSMPLTLPVSDEPIQRLSQVLTDNGYITTDTCEGHGDRLPHAFLHTEDQSHLRHLTHILARESGATNYRWKMTVWSSSPWLNPDIPLSYLLEPDTSSQDIDPKRDYDKLIQDLDIIGTYVMDYFNDVRAGLEEEASERKAKEERGLRSTPERVHELGNLNIPVSVGGIPIKPQVAYIWDGEQDDYKGKGTVVEEFMDGFEVQTDQVVPGWQHPFDNYEVRIDRELKLRHLVCDSGLVYSFPAKSD